MLFFGLDLAPSSAGMVYGEKDHPFFVVMKHPPNPHGVSKSWLERMRAASDLIQAMETVVSDNAGHNHSPSVRTPLCFIEDFASGRGGDTAHIELAEHRGFVIAGLVKRKWPFVLVHPARLKSFAGKSKDKIGVQKWVRDQIGPDLSSEIKRSFKDQRSYGDACDAYVLWALAQTFHFDQLALPKDWVSGDSSLKQPRLSYLPIGVYK